MGHERFKSCIEACNRCASLCEHCTFECLRGNDVQKMAKCIELNIYCAEVCRLAASFMSRGEFFTGELCRVCEDICIACAEECARHDCDHCKDLAQACKTCALECRRVAA